MSALLRVARLHASWSRGTMRGHCFRYLSSETSAGSQPSGGGRWVEAIDPATGFTFWYNEQTMEHRDKRPVEYNYQSFQDKPVDSKVKLVRGLDGRMWETPSGQATWDDPSVTPVDSMTVHGGGAPEGDGVFASLKQWLGFGETPADSKETTTPKSPEKGSSEKATTPKD